MEFILKSRRSECNYLKCLRYYDKSSVEFSTEEHSRIAESRPSIPATGEIERANSYAYTLHEGVSLVPIAVIQSLNSSIYAKQHAVRRGKLLNEYAKNFGSTTGSN